MDVNQRIVEIERQLAREDISREEKWKLKEERAKLRGNCTEEVCEACGS